MVFLHQFFDRELHEPQLVHIQGIQDPLPLSAALYDIHVHQHLHIVGQGGLADMKMFQQDAGAHFALGQQIKDFYPFGIGQGFEDSGHLDVLVFHCLRSLPYLLHTGQTHLNNKPYYNINI